MSNIAESQTVTAETHHGGRKTKGHAEVWGVDTANEITLAVTSEQGYAPGARGYSHGGVATFSASEARHLAALLLAAADKADTIGASQ